MAAAVDVPPAEVETTTEEVVFAEDVVDTAEAVGSGVNVRSGVGVGVAMAEVVHTRVEVFL